MTKLQFTTLNEMLQCESYQNYESNKLGNDLFINDPERAERIAEYAIDGCEGSTHAEKIEDMNDYLNSLKVYDPLYDYDENLADYDITQEIYDNIIIEIMKCQSWHHTNGSLYTIIN